jgi:hypothetical protein
MKAPLFFIVHLLSDHMMSSATLFPRKYWEAMCERNDFSWIIARDIWRRTWGDPAVPNRLNGAGDVPKAGLLIEDREGKGFVFLREGDKADWQTNENQVEICAVLVDQNARRQGVCGRMIREVTERKQYQGKTFWLEATSQAAVQAFHRCGFRPKAGQFYDETFPLCGGNPLMMVKQTSH